MRSSQVVEAIPGLGTSLVKITLFFPPYELANCPTGQRHHRALEVRWSCRRQPASYRCAQSRLVVAAVAAAVSVASSRNCASWGRRTPTMAWCGVETCGHFPNPFDPSLCCPCPSARCLGSAWRKASAICRSARCEPGCSRHGVPPKRSLRHS